MITLSQARECVAYYLRKQGVKLCQVKSSDVRDVALELMKHPNAHRILGGIRSAKARRKA